MLHSVHWYLVTDLSIHPSIHSCVYLSACLPAWLPARLPARPPARLPDLQGTDKLSRSFSSSLPINAA